MEVRSATAAVEPAVAAAEPASPSPVDDKVAATCGCCYLLTAFMSCFTG